MTKTLKNKWLKALKSGRYPKTVEMLQDKTGYCCLGVLCKVANLSIARVRPENDDELLSEFFLKRLGLEHTQQTALADLNDNTSTFQEKVIPWIEYNL